MHYPHGTRKVGDATIQKAGSNISCAVNDIEKVLDPCCMNKCEKLCYAMNVRDTTRQHQETSSRNDFSAQQPQYTKHLKSQLHYRFLSPVHFHSLDNYQARGPYYCARADRYRPSNIKNEFRAVGVHGNTSSWFWSKSACILTGELLSNADTIARGESC